MGKLLQGVATGEVTVVVMVVVKPVTEATVVMIPVVEVVDGIEISLGLRFSVEVLNFNLATGI